MKQSLYLWWKDTLVCGQIAPAFLALAGVIWIWRSDRKQEDVEEWIAEIVQRMSGKGT